MVLLELFWSYLDTPNLFLFSEMPLRGMIWLAILVPLITVDVIAPLPPYTALHYVDLSDAGPVLLHSAPCSSTVDA